jgi:hypothetical protein
MPRHLEEKFGLSYIITTKTKFTLEYIYYYIYEIFLCMAPHLLSAIYKSLSSFLLSHFPSLLSRVQVLSHRFPTRSTTF